MNETIMDLNGIVKGFHRVVMGFSNVANSWHRTNVHTDMIHTDATARNATAISRDQSRKCVCPFGVMV